MEVVFDKSFSKSLDKIKSKILKRKIEELIVVAHRKNIYRIFT
jgi:hypothetical protein